jgi:D-serine deaminase-like pyridoxal phosphate-dependent protein
MTGGGHDPVPVCDTSRGVARRELRNAALIGRTDAWEQLETPALCVDLEALESNIDTLGRWSRRLGLALRPHVKTHKCSRIARLQHAAGAVGVSAATLAEAEVMVDAEVGTVLLTSPVVGETKLGRLARLHQHAQGRLLVTTDSPESVAELEAIAAQTGRRLGVLVEHHAGQARSGCETRSELEALVRHVHASRHLDLAGLQHYFGHLQHVADPDERRRHVLELTAIAADWVRDLRAGGLALPIISGAGTGTLDAALASGFYTEVQAGSYVFMDRQYEQVLSRDPGPVFSTSLFVAARVCSVQSASKRGYVTIDAGQKALSIDAPGPRPRHATAANTRYAFFGDEHGQWYPGDGDPPPTRGTRIDLVPAHCDPTVALHDTLHVFRGHTLVDVWPIDARGHEPPAQPRAEGTKTKGP